MDVAQLIDRNVSHLLRTGLFEVVNGHEPQTPPTSGGLTAAVWGQRLGPVPAASGLSVTTARIVLQNRVYSRMQMQQPDAIDPAVIGAVDTLMTAYTGGFDLDGAVKQVDLLGAHGVALEAQAGYLRVGDGDVRVMTITVPLILNDAWEQAP